MYIGFDAKRAFLNRTGLGNYSRFLITGLMEMYPENRYALFTPRTGKNAVFAEGAEIFSAPAYLPGRTASLWRSFFLNTLLKKQKIEVFHGLSNELPAGSSGAATAVTIHDLIFLRYPRYYRSYDRAIYVKKFRSSCHRADLIIAVSNQTKEDIVNFFGISPEKVKVVYQDCDPCFHFRPQQEILDQVKAKYTLPDRFILTIGTVEERKNQLALIKAFEILNKGDISLVICGKRTRYLKKLLSYVAEKNLHKKVIFIDFVDFKDLPALYALASVFVYPSVFEGFGIPVLEAMNQGVPIVTSKGTCMEEICGNASLYSDPSNTEELAFQIERLLTDSSLCENLRGKGKERAGLYRKEAIIPQVMDLYKKIAAKQTS